MPLYEYLCEACGHKFEKIQKFSDPRETTCPKCGGAVHKLMSSPAIQFKGSGFYITDYAKKDHVASAKADKANGDRSEKGDSSGKSDKSEKSDKSDKAAKSDSSSKADSSGPSSSASSNTPAASSPPSTSSGTPKTGT